MEMDSCILGIAVAAPSRTAHLGVGVENVSRQARELKEDGTAPLSVISVSLSSESNTFANGRRGSVVRCLAVGRGCGGRSSSLSLESEGDWRAGISSSVSAPSLILLRGCWVGMALSLRGMVEVGR
jgi:hypothetical protein